jgi:hypothetical protein
MLLTQHSMVRECDDITRVIEWPLPRCKRVNVACDGLFHEVQLGFPATALMQNLARCLRNLSGVNWLQAACSLALCGICCTKQQY